MTKHSGGKVGAAGKALSNPKTSSKQKSKAAKTLNNHKTKNH
ncbi:hypothetical protein [Alkalicoccobacillus murimartini]|uniref:YuzL family protein n=1 Tax=Alkalicoccobacillus murimartini TaxID=171685 RepID=A0ABT9YNH4_9BACI|nr:hypothetical protein [Alkalicoccobacillus murimartini]MDQ0209041.1 hypothetical protein [Alkalicoccobacillus murimartini]